MNKFIAENSARLDVFLSGVLQISRNQIANLIKSNAVFVNSNLANKPSFKLNLGDFVEIFYPDTTDKDGANSQICEFEVEILYEDDDLLVINKPANLVVHSAPSVKEPTLVDWLKQNSYTLSTINGEIRAGIVHRLDKGTSGALVVAKTNFAHANLSEQLSDKSMGRIYLAMTDLALKDDCVIENFIGRSPSNRLKKAVLSQSASDARFAKSAFINLHSEAGFNLIGAKLFTGRTHQIRVHLASLNRHILGDTLYGFKSQNDKIERIFLHAYLLYFTHPRTGEMLKITANLPKEFENLIAKSAKKDEIYEKILPTNIERSFEFICSGVC
ncbi:MAG: RluA family pseudouridine synthase [Campylobacter sp.]|nr:RluA family pseudouridine synthase [Campylobacter sp.]